jgi:glycosyltransferase involved in cell wall biosynthesis
MSNNNPLMLLHVLRNDAVGGLEQSTLEVARYLTGRNVPQQVVFLCPLASGISTRFTQAGIPVHSIPFSKRRAVFFALQYWQLLRRLRPDVQLVSGAFGLHAPLAVLARLAGVQRCWTYLIMAPAGRGFPRFVQSVMGQMARLFTAGEIAVSGYLCTVFAERCRLPLRRMQIIYRWRDLNRIAREATLARELRQDPDRLVICTVGRLDWMKDFPTMLAAFAHVLHVETTAQFLIAGEGPLRSELEALAQQMGIATQVAFLGHRHDIPALLGGCDVFLFTTSTTEGIGNVMIEAMAAATPIVCTDVGPCQEVLADGAGGVLVAPGNPVALGEAVLALWRDPVGRAERAAKARALAQARYSADVCGAQLFDLLFSVPKGKSSI